MPKFKPKLTDQQRLNICKEYSQTHKSQETLARKYKVTTHTIHRVLKDAGLTKKLPKYREPTGEGIQITMIIDPDIKEVLDGLGTKSSVINEILREYLFDMGLRPVSASIHSSKSSNNTQEK